jgi:NAD(P)-dependent dehydrogenase (short-subunit alcohol dehydrogenase family)
MNRYEGRIATIIGSGSGMGRAIAQRLASEGAHVYVADRDGAAAKETVETIADAGGSAVAEELDATEVPALRDLFQRIDKEHGALHVMHNQVGMPGPAGMDITEEDWDLNIAVNLKTMWFSCAESLPVLAKADGKGAIIMTSSISALTGSPFSPLYSLTKGALPPFARGLAKFAAGQGVRANVICPGMVDTPMLPTFYSRNADADVPALMQATIDNNIPLGRPGLPADIAGVVSFLGSDDAAYVTGQTIAVDGGWTI